MAEGETEKEYDTRKAIEVLRERFQDLTTTLKESSNSPSDASLHFCQGFCQVLVEHASKWKTEEDPLPLLEVYTHAILSYAKATPCLSSECENVPLVLEKLALSCVELLLSLPDHVPDALWEKFQSSVKMAHGLLQESGNAQLHMLSVLAQDQGGWSNAVLCGILSGQTPETERVHEFLKLEGPTLLTMRIKHLMKVNRVGEAATLAKVCSEYPGYEGKGNFKQSYMVYACMTKTQDQLMTEMAQVDCKEALEMICNLESEGEEKAALALCSVFLQRQLALGEVYCAWELTLFWSKLVMRVEASTDAFLAQCRKMALLSRSVCHILFLIKVIQSEVEATGLPACIEMCIQALQMASNDNTDSKTTICKTISCLLPADLDVKRACQLTEFLLHPGLDSYYAVETLYNEPDQKLEEEDNLPVPNSLRCELLLALKTQWPFDPEFWDWRTLKRNCLSLMGDEASIVSSVDTLDVPEDFDVEAAEKGPEFTDLEDFLTSATNELNEIADEKEKNREAKKLREQGFVSARFRNWRAYMQYCVLCDKEFLGHRIVRHAQKHFKDGVYMCPICADSFESREVLDPHVASHVKQSCKERLAAMKTQSKPTPLRQPPKSPGSHAKQGKDAMVKVEGQDHAIAVPSVQTSPMKPTQIKAEQQEVTDDCSCPVTNCHKVFKFFRHLMCHVRAHKDDEEATHFLELQKQKVVCQYCRRHFVNVKHLNDHLQMHCGTRPYFCIQLDCTANFNSNSELLMHRRLHTEFKAKCMFPNCGQVFGEAHLLYDHEAQHYLTYTCTIANCGKTFESHQQFKVHQESHGPYNVTVTSKSCVQPKITPPIQFSPKKEPVQFSPRETPPHCSPRQTPQQFSPRQTPTQFSPRQTPSQFSPRKDTSHFSPRKEPIQFSPQKEPSHFSPQEPLQSSPKSDEKGSAFVRLERINTQELMRDGSMTLATTESRLPPPQDSKEPSTVRVKHSIESMLNSATNPPTEPQKCYTPLTPPPALQSGASNPTTPHGSLNMGSNGEKPVYPSTVNPMQGGPPTMQSDNNGVSPVHRNSLPQIFPTPQIKLENPFSMIGYPNTTALSSSDEPAHTCPFDSCPRSYSTNKSLSRHVKKIHPDIFENWKLSKKYNKVAKITARKVPPRPIDVMSPCHDDGSQSMGHLSSLCNSPGMQQMEYPMVCSSSPAPCYPGSTDQVPITPMINHSIYPQWGSPHSPHHPTGMIQPDMSQAWSSPSMNNCYADAYHLNEYPSRSVSHWQSDTYHTPAGHLAEGGKEHPMAAIHGGNMPQVTSESSLMNEMSQYVSSSLMLDNGLQMNGGHQYGMVHPDVQPDGVDASLMRKSGVSSLPDQLGSVSTPTVDCLPGGIYNPSYVSDVSSSLSPRPAVEIQPKEIGPDAQFTLRSVKLEATTTEIMPPNYQMENSVDGTVSPSLQGDVPYEDDAAECESVASADIKSGDGEGGQKGKKVRHSKRTKWPAIIKDGKVICRRCFREFSSTKSLGGHLSKRSQCKPLDEIDLTADLPTSFLDFLNDPHVPDTNGSLFNMANGDYTQGGFNMNIKTEMTAQPLDFNPSTGSQSNMSAPSGIMGDDSNSNTDSVVGPQGNVENTFQRVDLIEAAREKIMMELKSKSEDNTVASGDLDSDLKMKVKKEEVPREKPFKCDQDNCDYGFMTKEALFRHLGRMHDYSFDRIEELKKTPVKLAPYPCQICPKTFTRTTGLRIHYEKVHRLSKAEMAKLKVGCRNRKRASNPNTDTEPDGCSQGHGSSFGSVVIKQEPLDVAIAGMMEGVDQDENSRYPDEIEAWGAGEPGPTEHVQTVEDNSSASSERTPSGLASPYKAVLSPVHKTVLSPVRNPVQSPVRNPVQSPVHKIVQSPPVHRFSPVHRTVLSPERRGPVPQVEPSPKVDLKTVTALPKTVPEFQADSSLGPAMEAMSPEKPGSSKSTPCKDESQRREKPKKRVGLKMGEFMGGDSSFSIYRPYRCVHEGCSAAFTIQQNLILHYRAMHQSALAQGDPEPPKPGVAGGQESPTKSSEVRCQVKDCSRIFQGITKLIQHYLLLHKFTRDKATALVSSMKVGTFQCDTSQCTLPFDSVEKYIEHIKNFHKEIAISESGTADPTFKCEHEGCDRVYTTRSNLLRHLMKKHGFVVEGKNPPQVKTTATSPNNGKESMEKFKLKKKNVKKKDVRATFDHWTDYGKPALKSHDEASSMCTKKSSLQYPCMIKGCEAVERAERNIFRHYTTHGLTERYIEEQRSQFIFCKKLPRVTRYRNSNISEGMSTSSSSVESDGDEGDPHRSKLSKQAQDTSEGAVKDDGNDESSVERRPRRSCSDRNTVREQGDDEDSFNPLAYENSFLQFLEGAESADTSKRKMTDGSTTELPPKRQRTLQKKVVFTGCQNLVNFRNPLNLKSVTNVKIVVDKTFSDGAELLLKQLQDMRPMVIIKKWLIS